ncbi:MAG: FKBP-type peptidyl-prolyl cis-trans isomerase [Bacteroidales bacterium]|nr:FKBP-type peptidyl-prolyl cis-trans isomerase [Bacteroidales bacterium]
MKTTLKTFLLFSCIGLILSCNNNKKDNQSATTDKEITDTTQAINDTSNVAVLIFNSDGGTDYVIDKIDNIYRKTKSGLEYKYIKSGKSEIYPKVGDVVYFDMTYSTIKDSLVFDTRMIDADFKMRITPPSHSGGCFEEALMIMRAGDSAAFKIDAKNFLNYTQDKVNIPSYIKRGDKFIFRIKMKKIVDGSDYVKQNAETYQYYISQEASLIERYVLNINFPRKVTKSGLNIFTISKGTGKKPQKNNLVTIEYTAGFIDGSVFDSTIERKKPFRFVVGNNEVIDGLEEAVKMMNVGDHCLTIIPFRIAYGEEKNGVVAPFSTLVFEIELLDVE